MDSPRAVLINGAFLDQAVTGQQRYGREMLRALSEETSLNVRTLQPRGWWSKSALRIWLWSQMLGMRLGQDEYLLTLTSRGPILCPRQIVAIHDLFVINHPEWYSRKYALTHGIVLRQQLRSALAVLAVSEPVGRQAVSETRGVGDFTVVPNAPSEPFLHWYERTDIDVTLQRYGLEFGKYVLSVASVDPRKNVARLVQAHRALPLEHRTNHPLVLVGSENRNFGSVLIEGHDDLVRLGYVDDNHLAHLYAGSSLVAFPSLDEGFGLPAVEALATGANLLTSDVEVLKWVCQSHATYVDPKNAESIRAGLQSVLDAEPVSVDLRRRRRQYVLSRFDWKESSRRLTSLIHTL